MLTNKDKVLALLHSDFEGPSVPCTCDAFLRVEYDQPWFPLCAYLCDRYGGSEYGASPYINRISSLLFVRPCWVEGKTEEKLFERLARVMHLAYNEPLKYRAWFVYKAAGTRKIRMMHQAEFMAALNADVKNHNANELMQQREDELEDAALGYAEKSMNKKGMRHQK